MIDIEELKRRGILTGGIHAAPNIPHVILDHWSLWRVGEAHHLVGYCYRFFEGRVSSPLGNITLNEEGQVSARSRSGKFYETRGLMGLNADAEYVRNGALRAWQMPVDTDQELITDQERLKEIVETLNKTT